MTNEEMVQEYQNGNYEMLDELIEKNTGLVIFFANKYKNFGKRANMEFDDLVQEGWTGFINAVSKYNPNSNEKETDEELDEDEQAASNKEVNKNASFSTYASYLIKGRMLRAINVNIPREKKSNPYSEPIMVNSIHSLVPGSDDTTLEETLLDEHSIESYEDIESSLDNEILRKDLLELLDIVFGEEFQANGIDFSGVDNVISLFDKLLDGITAKEVILLRYGLFGKPMTFQEIGRKVGLSSARIEQIHYKGLSIIRNHPFGRKFIQKYKPYYFGRLEYIQNSVNEVTSPENVLTQMEGIDDLVKSFLQVTERG